MLLGVSVVTFALLNVIPGDPASTMLGAFATDEARATLRKALGLDKPVPLQYLIWLWNVLHLNFGRSFVQDQPVFPIAMGAFINTLVLFPISFAVFVISGLVGGILSAVHRGSWLDRLPMAVALVGTSMPVFWLGLLLIIVFSLKLHLLPAGGMSDLFGTSGPLDVLKHAVLPALVAAAIPAGTLARIVRSSVLETLNADFVHVLRAYGTPWSVILGRHVLRNAFPAILSMIGLQTGYLLGGQVFAEVVFAWPGIGYLLYQAILQRDLPVIQASVLLVTFAFVLVTLAVDLLYPVFDPRIRYA